MGSCDITQFIEWGLILVCLVVLLDHDGVYLNDFGMSFCKCQCRHLIHVEGLEISSS